MKKIGLALAFAGFAIIWPTRGYAECEIVDDKPAAGKVDFEFPIASILHDDSHRVPAEP